ncbi:MAG: grasp-with-spasm system SPASM domain peptide maturase [Bacteroidia bacterium]|nr:grasp-with-spasm system SPASM domain peptide maturase [Bacteroidia bacterium]
MEKNIPILYSCCIPVKGASRSIVCDLQRKSFLYIPNSLYEILTLHRGKRKEEIFQTYDNQYNDTIQEYFDFLVEQEMLFYCDDSERFPKMSMDWMSPAQIQDSIIDIGAESAHDWDHILSQLEGLGCRHIQVRSFVNKSLDFWQELMEKVSEYAIISVEIHMKHGVGLEKESLNSLVQTFPQIFLINVHSSPFTWFAEGFPRRMGNLQFSKVSIDSETHCGVISPSFFIINEKTFTEGWNHNSCLNRKISVDQYGMLKNCPSMVEAFGLANETDFEEVLKKEGFTKLWNINKDQVEVCKSCEFRYICTDCRAYIQNPNDPLSKPAKCNYNPALGKWETVAETSLA